VINPCYGSSHVIYGLKPSGYEFKTLTPVTLRRLQRRGTFFAYTPLILDPSVSFVHTWNAIPVNKDFIVSFELELPRYLENPTDNETRFGLSQLASERCKRILALSDFAFAFAKRGFEKHGFGSLVQKMKVFRGAVPDPLSGSETAPALRKREPFSEKPLSAVIIGTQLFRKGGMYAVDAFERLRNKGIDVRLTLIGGFERKSYTFRDNLPDREKWLARCRSHDWIRFEGPVPYSRVFPELRSHDLCIYTSLDESLGWLPIEAGMLGVPVVATKTCALPELVAHRRSGWLIDLPLREDGRWAGLDLVGPEGKRRLEAAGDMIVEGIQQCVHAVLEDPSLLNEWGAYGRKMIKGMYDEETASRELAAIYDDALNEGNKRRSSTPSSTRVNLP
jgi:glycosyltransferase involved in cell wall biosynthesis